MRVLLRMVASPEFPASSVSAAACKQSRERDFHTSYTTHHEACTMHMCLGPDMFSAIGACSSFNLAVCVFVCACLFVCVCAFYVDPIYVYIV